MMSILFYNPKFHMHTKNLVKILTKDIINNSICKMRNWLIFKLLSEVLHQT